MHTPLPADEFKITTFFLVRHADKAVAPREDSSLNDEGKLRAEELARMLEGSGVNHSEGYGRAHAYGSQRTIPDNVSPREGVGRRHAVWRQARGAASAAGQVVMNQPPANKSIRRTRNHAACYH